MEDTTTAGQSNRLKEKTSISSTNFPNYLTETNVLSKNYNNLKIPYRKYFIITLAIAQMLVSIGLFIFGINRYRQIFNKSFIDSMTLWDFIKSEDNAKTNQEGTAIVGVKLGASIFVPAILQFLSSLTALFPLYRRPPKFYMVKII